MTARNHMGKSYYLLNKPFNVLCQFTDALGRTTLSDVARLPKDVYAAGRLDFDSEGLLLLTNDNEVNHRLTEPIFEHERTYLVQVEGEPTDTALNHLREGVRIGEVKTKPVRARLLEHEPTLPPRNPPIRVRKTIPTSWIELKLREGKNHQVRRMTAAIGHPTLRLVRTAIGNLELGNLKPGESRELSELEVKELRRYVGL